MIELTFLQSKIGRLAKTVRPTGIDNYPLAAQFLSHHINATTLDEFAAGLRHHANLGHCLHVGNLNTPFTEWTRRAGAANRNAASSWFVLDIDNLKLPFIPTKPIGAEQFAEIADSVMQNLGISELFDVSYIAQASTKLGLSDDTISMHVFFGLSEPTAPIQIKTWMKSLNLNNRTLRNSITLSTNGHALKWPLDVACADPGRLIYIAPPIFHGVADPFQSADARIIAVHKRHQFLDAEVVREATISQRAEKQIRAQLREAAGLNPRENPHMRTVVMNGERVELLLNPAPGVLRLSHKARGFCYYHLNDGTSAAYYHPENRPEVIFNFKEEPAMRWADIDPKGYAAYCEENAEAIAEADPIATFMVIDRDTDQVYKVWHNHEAKTVAVVASDKTRVEDFYTENGKIPPDFLPTWTIEYNPPAEYRVDYNGKTINTFRPSALMQRGIVEIPGEPLNIASASIVSKLCPSIWFTLDHVAGNDRDCVARFLNWLAYIMQRRNKTQTAWVFQGVEGTGKGTLYDEIISKILGDDNVTMRRSVNLADQFDAWRKSKLLVAFDEFQVENNTAGRALISTLRNWITEERASVRAMRREGADTNLFENYVFFSNMHNMIPLPESDRRYNVCPRQDRVLSAICDTNELYAAIRNEVQAFSSLLLSWELDENAVRVCLNNSAKQLAREASRTMPEEFVAALSQGNLDYLMQLIDANRNNTGHEDILSLDHAQRTLRELIRHRHTERTYAIADLCNLYNVLYTQKMPVIGFSKMISRLGLKSERVKLDGTQLRGCRLQMNKTELSDDELDAIALTASHLHAVGSAA